jgi:hypothetical protein
MRPLERGPCEGVEDPAALAALEVHDRSAMATVNPEMVPLSTARASQAIRMEQFDEFGGAGVLVQVVDQREVPDPNLRVPGVSPLRTPPLEAIVKSRSTCFPS